MYHQYNLSPVVCQISLVACRYSYYDIKLRQGFKFVTVYYYCKRAPVTQKQWLFTNENKILGSQGCKRPTQLMNFMTESD